MLAALRAYDQVRDAAAIRSWLFSIAARKAVDSHRGARALAGAHGRSRAGGRQPRTRRCATTASGAQVRSLPAKQRTAVTLRYLGDLSHAEIAEVMGTSEAAARRNVFEGLARLRELVEPMTEGPA